MLPDTFCGVSMPCPDVKDRNGVPCVNGDYPFTLGPYTGLEGNDVNAVECKLECLKRETCLSASFWSYNNTNICTIFDAPTSAAYSLVCGGLQNPIIGGFAEIAGLDENATAAFDKAWVFGCRAEELTLEAPLPPLP
jgi:hypothetical protein